MLAFTCGEFLLHIPCWLYIYLGSFSYTSRSGFIFICGVSLTHPTLALIFCREFLTHPMLLFFCCCCFYIYSGEFLLHIPCLLHFYAGSFADSSRTGLISIWVVSLTHPMLALFFGGWGGAGGGRGAFILGSLSYTSHAGFFFFFFFKSRKFLFPIPCWLRFYAGSFSYTSRTGFIFYLGSFSYTSHICFVFLWGVYLTHPTLALFLSGEFLLHIPCLLFVWGVSLTHPMLAFL